MSNPLPDDTLARIKELLAQKRGPDYFYLHTTCALLLSRLEAAEARAAAAAEVEGWKSDIRRYQRLRILGAAPFGSDALLNGNVLRFTGLDDFIDLDLLVVPSRGEAITANPKDTEDEHQP